MAYFRSNNSQANEYWKSQARQSEFAWRIRKDEIIRHAKQFRDSIGQGTPNDYIRPGFKESLPTLFSSEALKLYRSPQSRKWLGRLKNMLDHAAWSARRGQPDPKAMVTPKKLRKGFRAIAKEEMRYREEMKKQEELLSRRSLEREHGIKPDYGHARVYTPEVNPRRF